MPQLWKTTLVSTLFQVDGLLEQLSQHKLDMIISAVDRFLSRKGWLAKIGSVVSVSVTQHYQKKRSCLEERHLLIPGRRSMLGRKLLNWFSRPDVEICV